MESAFNNTMAGGWTERESACMCERERAGEKGGGVAGSIPAGVNGIFH